MITTSHVWVPIMGGHDHDLPCMVAKYPSREVDLLKGNIGNLEFMESVSSVGIIKPGNVLRSELVYRFSLPPNNLEMSFQSVMRGDKVFFSLGF